MKMKIAVYQVVGGVIAGHISVREYAEFWDESKDVVRLTEPLEVEFVDLPNADLAERQIAVIDAEIKEVRAELTAKITRLESRRAELLALPAPEVV
jgi:hypothetical protein